MNIDEAKSHFDLKPSTNKSKDFTVWKYLVQFTWVEDEWAKLDSNLNLQTFYLHLGKVTNQEGLVMRKLIIWKLDITWGRLDQ